MKVLSIESSCDETSASVVKIQDNVITVLSHITATSLDLHSKTGGIIPENAAREQVKYIMPVIIRALIESKNETIKTDDKENYTFAQKILKQEIDSIAVTYGPGLIGSLLVGVETAKTLSFTLNKPLIPVNHLLAHLFANFISQPNVTFPFIGLIVSGGHTDLLHFKSVSEYEWLGGTRDDAAGEALDKIGRLMNLSYPAGPEIEKRAKQEIQTKIAFKSPILNENTFDFSFSGLKAEVMRYVQNKNLSEDNKNEICFAVQKAVIDVLVKKTLAAAQQYNCPTILLGGGVSANQTLKENFKQEARSQKLEVKILSPEKVYCTDNAAMIGAYALLNTVEKPWKEVFANPNLHLQ